MKDVFSLTPERSLTMQSTGQLWGPSACCAGRETGEAEPKPGERAEGGALRSTIE